MRSRSWVVGVAAVVAVLAISQPAVAKGASRATITGPDLASPIEIGVRDGRAMERLAGLSGIYPALFETTPNPMLKRMPVEVLGPRYEAGYLLKAPGYKANVVVQELYPYAQPAPVTYVEPGQPTFGSGRSVGGWYRADASLLTFLVSKGLPDPDDDAATGRDARGSSNDAAAAPDGSDDEGTGPMVVALALAAVIAGGVAVQRRRWRSAHA